jgi:hypothetical protein
MRQKIETIKRNIPAALYARLSEPNFWRGLIAIVTACGVSIEPQLKDAIIACGLTLIGIIDLFKKPKNCDKIL